MNFKQKAKFFSCSLSVHSFSLKDKSLFYWVSWLVWLLVRLQEEGDLKSKATDSVGASKDSCRAVHNTLKITIMTILFSLHYLKVVLISCDSWWSFHIGMWNCIYLSLLIVSNHSVFSWCKYNVTFQWSMDENVFRWARNSGSLCRRSSHCQGSLSVQWIKPRVCKTVRRFVKFP